MIASLRGVMLIILVMNGYAFMVKIAINVCTIQKRSIQLQFGKTLSEAYPFPGPGTWIVMTEDSSEGIR